LKKEKVFFFKKENLKGN